MKTTLIKSGPPEPKKISELTDDEFPCLGIHNDGQIVLFTRIKTGTQIIGPIGRIGFYSETWVAENFTVLPSDQIVQLQND